MDARQAAAAIAKEAKAIRKRYPDQEQFISTDYANGRLSVRKSNWPDGVVIEVPVTRSGHTQAAGANVVIGFDQGNRQRPFVKSILGMARGVSASTASGGTLVLALWPDCTGSPYCNRGPLLTCDAPQWDGAATVIDTLPRYYYDSSLQTTVAEGESAPTLSDLLSWEGITLLDSHPSTSLPRAACTVSLYDGTGGSLIGQLLREYQLEEGAWTQTGEWIHLAADPIGSLPTNNAQRRQGYLTYDKTSDTYTIASNDGLLLATRGNEPTPTLCAWETAYGSLPGNSSVSVAGGYAITGAYQASGIASDCAVDLYYRHSGGYWVHLAQVDLAAQLPDCDYVYACGIWDPQQDTGELGSLDSQHNSRWAYMAGEWYVFITGRAGDETRPDVAKAKVLAIRAATGAVRVVEAYDAPLELLQPWDGNAANVESIADYQNDPHPENWEPTGLPGGLAYADTGDAQGRTSGPIGNFITVPEDDVHPTTGGPLDTDYRAYQQKIKVATWISRDPTIAPVSQQLECGNTVLSGLPCPRGVVDSALSRFYLLAQHRSWLAGETPDYGGDDGLYDYTEGDYVDFAGGTIPGDPHPIRVHILRKTGTVEASVGWGGVTPPVRLVVRKYSSSALLATLDLTRTFTATVDDKLYTYLKAPSIYEYAVAGDYLWLLCSDWWGAADQRLTMIVVDKSGSGLTEVDRLDLTPDTDRLWMAEKGRPQLVVGVDGSGPWAEVLAWWTGDPNDEWIVQELRVVSDELAVASRAQEAFASNYPDKFGESINVAISPLKQFFLDDSVDFKVREE